MQQAIDGFRPYVRSVVPVSPSHEQVVELGDKICTGFDEGRSVDEIKAAGRAMAESAPFVSVGPGGEDYILRTGTALYCPGHASKLS